MFGRHPRLAVDAYLGLQSTEQSEVRSKEHYGTKLKKRLQFAYKVASNEARKNTDRHKRNYDLKVREATLDVGDRVLVRRVGFRGRHKIADRWEKTPYVVTEIPIKDVPVYKVQKESGDQVIKTLYRNMFLPFCAIPGKWEVPDMPARPQRTRNVAKRVQDERVSEHDSDSDHSETDSISEIHIPHPAVQRKRYRSRRQNIAVPSPILDEVSRSYITDSFNEPSVTFPGSPVSPSVYDIDPSVSFPGTQANPSVDNSGQTSIGLTESDVSNPLDYPVVPTPEQERYVGLTELAKLQIDMENGSVDSWLLTLTIIRNILYSLFLILFLPKFCAVVPNRGECHMGKCHIGKICLFAHLSLHYVLTIVMIIYIFIAVVLSPLYCIVL